MTETDRREENPVFEATGITEVYFSYDSFSGDLFCLNARAEHFDESGADVVIEKRLGPRNRTGTSKKGSIHITPEEVRELQAILKRYDLDAWSRLRRKSASSSPSRVLMVWEDDKLYEVPGNAVFPETIPPQQDIMYFELFVFFNGLLKKEDGWEDVIGEDLEDPRDNPAYKERSVLHFGREAALKKGTGTFHTDGKGAEIDYGGDPWWNAEGFTGTWQAGRSAAYPDLENTSQSCTLTVNDAGHCTLVIGKEIWQGTVPSVRRYRCEIGLSLEKEKYERRSFDIWNIIEDSYEELRLTSYPLPYPEEQYDETEIILIKTS